MASIAVSPPFAGRVFSGVLKAATRNVRWTIVISTLLIFGSFVSAAVIQMRLDRMHALDQAQAIERERAHEMAAQVSATLDRYAAIGRAFANAQVGAETSAALSEAGGDGLENVAVLDGSGRLLSEMKRPPGDLLPLDPKTLSQARIGRTIFVKHRSIVIALAGGGHIILVQLARTALLPAASTGGAVLVTDQGRVLAGGRGWHGAQMPLAPWDAQVARAARTIAWASSDRLVALAAIPGWPGSFGESMERGEALRSWYGALPLYFFFIFGPAFAGAGLAMVFVREMERHMRSAGATRKLHDKSSSETKLLIRLADAERNAVEAERSKAEFLMHMSHELRTPLNAIIGFSEVIAQGLYGSAGHPKYQEYARDIRDAGHRLHAKIGDILEFASLEAGKQSIQLMRVDAAAVVHEAVVEIEGRASAQKMHIETELPPSAPCIGDANCLKHALGNLLGNALQYTPEGGALRVEVRSDDLSVHIAVQDSGFGFSPAETVRAGTAFVRFDRPGAVTGTGLGLAIANALVRRMGGSLHVSGKQGDGARAEINLRRAQ